MVIPSFTGEAGDIVHERLETFRLQWVEFYYSQILADQRFSSLPNPSNDPQRPIPDFRRIIAESYANAAFHSIWICFIRNVLNSQTDAIEAGINHEIISPNPCCSTTKDLNNNSIGASIDLGHNGGTMNMDVLMNGCNEALTSDLVFLFDNPQLSRLQPDFLGLANLFENPEVRHALGINSNCE